MSRIRFGTDGWRAIIGEAFTFDNVRLVTQAVADHVRAGGQEKSGLVVGYDTRFLGERFAAAVAEVFVGNAIPVFLTDGALPTPIVAWGIKSMGTAGGIVVTASHNPPEYSGLKFIPDYAGPATSDITAEIERNIAGTTGEMIRRAALSPPLVHSADPLPSYREHLRAILDFAAISRGKLSVVVDSMYGATQNIAAELFSEAGCQVEVIHDRKDPLFGGRLPDPTEQNLGELISTVRDTGADLGLAFDGDGDRFGIVDSELGYLNPNQVLGIIAFHLLERGKFQGDLVRSVATTHLLDAIAHRHQREVYETPVGFKHIAERMQLSQILMGGEESGGFSFQGHIPEKDGILATMLLTQVRAEGPTLSEIQKRVQDEYGVFVSSRLDFSYAPDQGSLVREKLQSRPELPARYTIESVVDTDGRKYVLADGSWILVRPSGTEPVVRIYLESHSQESLAELEQVVKTFWENMVGSTV